MRDSTKQKWAGRLMYSPFLQLLVLKPAFGAVVAFGFLLLVLLGLSLPPFWQTSPDGFTPPIRLSTIQRVQAWSQQRAAVAASGAGRHDESFRSWGRALGYNPGDAALFRSYFQELLLQPKVGQLRSVAWYVNWARQIPAVDLMSSEDLRLPLVAESQWFLRLTRTNRSDVELVGRVFVKLGYDSLLPRLLAPMGKEIPPDLAFALMRERFAWGDYVGFAELMRSSADGHAGDPVFALYRAAYEAGVAGGASGVEAKQRLRESSKAGDHRVVASRLLLWVCEREPDVAGAQAALGELIRLNQATLRDHTSLWRTLTASGRGAEAARLVVAMSEEPATAVETVELAEVCVGVGLRDRAATVLRRSLDVHGLSASVFIPYAALLAEDQKLFELRELALRIRMQDNRTEAYTAFSQFIEARVAVGEGQPTAARDTFGRLDTVKYEDPQIALAIAAGLLQLKTVPPAASILTQLEGALKKDARYWATVAQAARLQTNEVLLLRATQRRHELDPMDLRGAVEYADALMAQRIEADRALELTGRSFKSDPQNLGFRVRHAAALAMNGRGLESREILDQTDERQVKEPDLAIYLLARFEACLKLGRADDAWAQYDRIPLEQIFPAQRQWVADAIKGLPPRTRPVGGKKD